MINYDSKMVFHSSQQSASAHPYHFPVPEYPPPPPPTMFNNAQMPSLGNNGCDDKSRSIANEDDEDDKTRTSSGESDNNSDDDSNSSTSASSSDQDSEGSSSNSSDTDGDESDNETKDSSLVETNPPPFFPMMPYVPYHHMGAPGPIVPFPPPPLGAHFYHQPMMTLPNTEKQQEKISNGLKSNEGNRQIGEKVVVGVKRRRTINNNTGIDLCNNEEKKDDAEVIVVAAPNIPDKKIPRHPLASKYPHLSEFKIPLGDSIEDFKCRELILSELVRFQSNEYCQNMKTKDNSIDIDVPSKDRFPKGKATRQEAEANPKEADPTETEATIDVEAEKSAKDKSGRKSSATDCTFLGKDRVLTVKRHPLFRYDYLLPIAKKRWKKSSKGSKFPTKHQVYRSCGSTIEALLELWFYIPETEEFAGVHITLKERKEAAARYMLKYLSVEYCQFYVELLSTRNSEVSRKARKATARKKEDNETTELCNTNKDGGEEGSDDRMSRKDVIMDAVNHDGSEPSRKNLHWNLMFQRLIDYKDLYGDFTINVNRKSWETRDKSKDPKEKIPVDWKKIKIELERQQKQTNDQQDVDANIGAERGGGEKERVYCNLLAKWVFRQRNLYRYKSPELTPKRIELLESIGLEWEKIPDIFVSETNVPYHKAVAARLCFGLSCIDALVFAGFPEEEAKSKRRKKLICSHSANLYKPEASGPKGPHIKAKIEFWMNKIYAAGKLNNDEHFFSVLEEIYGPSEILNEWYAAGRIVLNRLHPSKRKRTDETLSEDGKTYMSHRPTGADVRWRLTS